MTPPHSCDWANDLPTEILVEILLLTKDISDVPFPESHNPWLLGQICSRWRSIAICTPRLWSSVLLFSPTHLRLHFLRIEAILESLALFIPRSGQFSLKLSLDARWSHKNREALMELLLPQSQRWQHLHIHYLDPSPKRRMLTMLKTNNFASLKTLRFSESSFGLWDPDPFHMVFPKVTSLRLTKCSTDLITRLTTPQLDHLELKECGFLDFITGLDITTFVQRSACPLARLALHHTPISELDLIALLKLLPALVELEIDYAELAFLRIGNTLFTSLHSRRSIPCVVPKLRRVSLGDLSRSSLDLLLDMLESRTSDEMGCMALQSAQLETSTSFSVQTMLRVEVLCESGMNVETREEQPGG
ncbi:hypothetical protein C8F04DRAFT_1388964 [Mycena alexandri]|uniref:F-box domain-containing protein n=1 Tax=Mycena alexandri TaxID=1745969 RepID=A0AAD6TFW6_9AGAR|nr:hypothetical protein C8F04DRAFT_1388964 [Mycena alexandri]